MSTSVRLNNHEIFSVLLDHPPLEPSVTGVENVALYSRIKTAAGEFALIGSSAPNGDTYVLDLSSLGTAEPKCVSLPQNAGLVSIGSRHDLGGGRRDVLAPTQLVVQRNGSSVHIINGRDSTPTDVNGNRVKGKSRDFADTYADYSRVTGEDRKASIHYKGPTADAPYGTYRGFKILGRESTTVRDSILIGPERQENEAIVVTHSNVLRNAFKKFINEYLFPWHDQQMKVLTVLHELNQFTHQLMPYDLDKVAEFQKGAGNGHLVHLDHFVNERFGVCRHHAMFAAYTIETMIRNKRLPEGTVSVGKNSIPNVGGHAWAMYTPDNPIENLVWGAKPIVVDPTQQFVGTDIQAEMQGRWPYRLRIHC